MRHAIELTIGLSLSAVMLMGCSAPAPDDDVVPEATRPTGPPVVFQWAESGVDRLWTAPGGGSAGAPLESGPAGPALHPDPSPDGTQIVAAIDTDDGVRQIWIVPVSGGEPRLLVPCDGVACASLDYPSWSHDGSSIVFTQYDGPGPFAGPPDSSRLRVVDVATGASRQLASSRPGSLVDNARWSADDATVVFQIDTFTAGTETGLSVAIVPASGGETSQLTEPSLFGGYPDFSPVAADLIVFCTYDLGPFPDSSELSDLYTVTTDGSDPVQITHSATSGFRVTQPSFDRSGEYVLATLVGSTGRDLGVVDLSDGTIGDTGVPGTHFRELASLGT